MLGINKNTSGLQRRLIQSIAVGSSILSLVVSWAAYGQQPSGLLRDWSYIEKKTWAQLQNNGRAVLAQGEAISAEFLDDVLTGKVISPTVQGRGVTIIGGTITGPLNLRNSKIDMPVVHLSSEIVGPVDISDSEFTGTLSFRGSHVPGGLTASRALIAGSFQLGDLDDTKWFSEWVADRGPTYSVISSLVAPHLRLRGDFVLAGASIQGGVDLSNADIGGSVTLMHLVTRGVDRGIDISASKIDNELIIYDCSVYRPQSTVAFEFPSLALHDIKINQTAYVTRSLIDGTLDISDAVIEGDLNLRGSDLSRVKAQSTRVSGSFIFGVNTVPPLVPTRWHEPSVLDLTDARFGAVRAPEILDVWPKHIHLEHFRTTMYGHEFCGAETEICQHSPMWYATLLERQASPRPSYEPYKQIGEMLVSQGLLQEAISLSVQGHNVMRDDALRHHEIFSYLAMLFYGWTVGYGYHAEYAIFWAIFFTIIGAFVFRTTPEAVQNNMPYGLAYSFDMLLPIVHLREMHYKIDLSGFSRYYFYFHKLVGWTLGLLLAAVMAGITR
jgi:hypothetical protein